MDAPLDAIHRLLLLHLHRVAQTQRPKKQILVFLQRQTKGTATYRNHFLWRQQAELELEGA